MADKHYNIQNITVHERTDTQKKIDEKRLKVAKRAERKQGVRSVVNFVTLIGAVLLLVYLLRLTYSGGVERVSFAEILTFLKSSSDWNIPFESMFEWFTWNPDLPYWLDWLEPIIGFVGDLLRLIAWIVVGVLNSLKFILDLLAFAFF